jgi:hypothetical protein
MSSTIVHGTSEEPTNEVTPENHRASANTAGTVDGINVVRYHIVISQRVDANYTELIITEQSLKGLD